MSSNQKTSYDKNISNSNNVTDETLKFFETMSIENKTKVELITRNLQEVLGLDQLQQLIDTKNEPIVIYWGTAPTGKPHIGYFTPLAKIADFLQAGCKVKILLADIHAFLDMKSTSFEEVEQKTKYYKLIITAMLQGIGVDINNLEFCLGSQFQLSQKYSLDSFKLAAMVTEHDAKKAGSEVVKQQEFPVISSLIYPNLQALDEEYLNCDCQFGGVDQRKIFIHSEKYLPKLGYRKRIHLMNYMVPGLTGAKMSASDIDSKIDILEEFPSLKKKIKKAFCEEGNIIDNGVLSFVKFVLFPIKTIQAANKDKKQSLKDINDNEENIPKLILKIPEKYGGNKLFTNYNDLEREFLEKKVHPGDLKNLVIDELNELLIRVHSYLDMDEVRNIAKIAYPQPVTKSQKKQKSDTEKNKNQ